MRCGIAQHIVMFKNNQFTGGHTACGARSGLVELESWHSQDYGMESEMIANVAKNKLRYRQVPIKTIYKDNYKGTSIVDVIIIVLRLLKWRYT